MSKIFKFAAAITASAAAVVPGRGVTGYASTIPHITEIGGKPVHAPIACNNMVNQNSGKDAEVYRSQKQNGANVDQWTANGTKTQVWCAYSVAQFSHDVEVYLVNLNSNKCLEVYHSSTNNGGKVDQWSCNGSKTQLWWVIPIVEKTHYLLENDNSGKCLEVYHSERNNGANVDQWSCNETLTQQWTPPGFRSKA